MRRSLSKLRRSITHHGIHMGEHGELDFWVTVGFFPGSKAEPGEVFVKIAKHGSDVKVYVDAWAIAISIALQHGTPWEKLFNKFTDYPNGGNVIETIAKAVDHCIQEELKHHEH